LISQNRFEGCFVFLLQRGLHTQAQVVAPYCREGYRSAVATIYRTGIALFQIAPYFTGIPGRRVPNVRDREVIVLAPKEWHVTEYAIDAEHRTRHRLTLSFRHDPVLDSRMFAENGFRVSRYIARPKNVGRAGTQAFVHNYTVLYLYASRFRQ
jgi:hypothetical protein